MAKKTRSTEGSQFVKWFPYVLDALRSLGGSGTPDEVADHIAKKLSIPDEQLNEVMASGALRFRNQVQWARFYLFREGLIGSSQRGIWTLTDIGRKTELTEEQSKEIYRRWYEVFRREKAKERKEPEPLEEQIAEQAGAVSTDYRERFLAQLIDMEPDAFERLSQRLLRESGFTQVIVTGRSGDGGIDGRGMLQINPLVSMRVMFQCKKYAGTVAPTQIRDFQGAITGRADKGIIITTGTFSAEARREASRDGAPPIELIDRERLLDMFEKLELGLKPITTCEIIPGFLEQFKKSNNVN